MLFGALPLTWTCNRLLYWPQRVVDGNMKLVRLFMKRPEVDISLSNGELFMVKWDPYADHLANSPHGQPVSFQQTIVQFQAKKDKKLRCNNHRAQNNGNLNRNHLDSTGKGTCACAQYGGFIPHCVVNFQKGEW